jgi:murein DD-endopeptidase MepM/ murein hydrolase activator NlpD
MDTNIIKFKDRAVALGIVALSIAGFVFVAQSARDSHELEKMREQNRILASELKDLEQSFVTIRRYTRNVNALSNGQVTPAELRRGDAAAPTKGFASLSLSAKSLDVKASVGESDLEAFTDMVSTIEDLNSETTTIVRRLNNLAMILRHNKELMRSIPSVKPAEGRVTSEFGHRLSPFEGKRHMHAGVDIAAQVGEKIKAPADGVVTFVGNFEALGNTVVINHGNGVLTRYGHTSKYLVKAGQKVKRGQNIAEVGNTGRSTGPHLHYEVWVKNMAVNPRDFFFDMTEKTDQTLAKSKGEQDPILDGMGGEF